MLVKQREKCKVKSVKVRKMEQKVDEIAIILR